jgi:hypothetical protein
MISPSICSEACMSSWIPETVCVKGLYLQVVGFGERAEDQVSTVGLVFIDDFAATGQASSQKKSTYRRPQKSSGRH